MEFFKRYKKLKLRKTKLNIIKLLKLYTKNGRSIKSARNNIIKNHVISKKAYLRLLANRDSIATELLGSSKRVSKLFESL